MIKPDKIFYTPELTDKVTSFILPEEESKHIVKVLRMQVGDTIHLINGKGGLFEAEITDPQQKRCKVKIITAELEYGKRNFYLHIAIAPTKMNERMEWFLEKATEIGVDEITPILCRYSERKEIKLPRMEKIMASAMKQSVKAYLPKLNPPCTFNELLQKKSDAEKFIAHCYESDKKLLKDVYTAKKDVLILVGPEGDFSQEEVTTAIEKGFIPVSLGDSRLRTETAGVLACHTIHIVNQ